MEAHGLTLPSCLASPCGSISDAFGFAGSGATEVPSLWLLRAEDIHLRQARILHFPFLPVSPSSTGSGYVSEAGMGVTVFSHSGDPPASAHITEPSQLPGVRARVRT